MRRLVISAILLAACGAAWAQGREEDPLLARAFEVRYRSLADTADLVGPLLSDDGALHVRPRLGTIVVEDRRSVLDRVEALLKSYDLPPPNIEVTLSLFLGIDRRDDSSAARRRSSNELTREVRGVIETLQDFTKWTSYEPLGSRSVTGTQGDHVVANLSDEYRVRFTVESIHRTQGVIRFREFVLQRVRIDDQGQEDVEDLYTTGMALRAGKLHVVGAASDPHSSRALFLTLQVKAR